MPTWEENDWWHQELILAYDAGRQIEESELMALLARARSA